MGLVVGSLVAFGPALPRASPASVATLAPPYASRRGRPSLIHAPLDSSFRRNDDGCESGLFGPGFASEGYCCGVYSCA